MQVEMLADVPYVLRPGMSPRVYGQARKGDNGTYLPKGSRPDFSDDEAAHYLAAGLAKVYQGQSVNVVPVDEIMDQLRAS